MSSASDNPFESLARIAAGFGDDVPDRPARAQRVQQLGQQLGLQFRSRVPDDFDEKVRLPSSLTSGTTGTENLLTGTWEGLPVRLFDRWSYTVEEDSQTHRKKKVWHRYSCALTRLGLVAPEPFQLEREGLFGRLADHIGLHDIELELGEFNKTFTVRCKDRKFATDVLDQRMMAWLLESKDAFPKDVAVQIDRRQMLVYSPERKPADVPPMLQLMKDVIDHFPPVAFSLYGAKEKPAQKEPLDNGGESG